MDEFRTYQRIGEFVVSFQWLENQLRQIGWFILDPPRPIWPPTELRKLTLESLTNRVEKLLVDAIPKCDLPTEMEAELLAGVEQNIRAMHRLRRDRNRILHSAYVELKAGGELVGILRSDPKLGHDPETGEPLLDQEVLREMSFERELAEIAQVGMFFGRCYIQLLHRLPIPGGDSAV